MVGCLEIRMVWLRRFFWGPIATKDVDFVEVCAIKVALDMYYGMGWMTNCLLMIETGSKVVLNWLLKKEQRSWTLQPLLIDIERRIIRGVWWEYHL